MPTKIEWCDETINPIHDIREFQLCPSFPARRGYHCTKISPGCDNCYAERFNKRFGNGFSFNDIAVFPVGHTIYMLNEGTLQKPCHWKRPRRIFVQSMSDLFHELVPSSFYDRILEVVRQCPQHTFIFLTKRPRRMMELCLQADEYPNLWLGVTAENQECADERIPILLSIPAAKKFTSIEPMLGPVDLSSYLPTFPGVGINTLGLVIGGGETGPGARPMHPNWVRKIRDDCVSSGTPFFFKGFGEYILAEEMPSRLAHYLDDKYRVSCNIGSSHFMRVGKKNAGRLLDGREWNEFPK